jgi:hypothetical protein
MAIGYAVAALFGGWCGSVPLSEIIRLILRGKRPFPDPPPYPWRRDWLISKVLGAVGGVVTSYVYWSTFGPQPEPWRDRLLGVAIFSFTGFLGGRFASELFSVARGGGNMNVSGS